MKSRYIIAQISRPLIYSIPVSVIIVNVDRGKWPFLATILIISTIIGLFTRCRNCNYSIYYDKGHPFRTWLAIPKKNCTVCGESFMD